MKEQERTDLFRKEKPFQRGPASAAGGKALWEAFVADAIKLIEGQYERHA